MGLNSVQRERICGHLEFGVSRLRDLKASDVPSRAAPENVDVLDAVLMKLQGAGESLYGVERAVNPKRKEDSKDPHYLDVRYPSEHWKGARHLRNIISHGYVTVDNDIVWDVIQNHVDGLIADMIAVIRDLSP